MRELDRRGLRLLLLIQLMASVAIAILAWIIQAQAGISALVGGLASLTGNLVFAVWIFAPYKAQRPGGLLSRFYLAEIAKLVFLLLVSSSVNSTPGSIIKLIVIGLVFAAAINWLQPLNVVALFGSFFVVQVLSPLLAHSMAE